MTAPATPFKTNPNRTACCGAVKAQGPDDGGAYETSCDDCGTDVCSECAAEFDVDGDADERGPKAYASATCRECKEDQ